MAVIFKSILSQEMNDYLELLCSDNSDKESNESTLISLEEY